MVVVASSSLVVAVELSIGGLFGLLLCFDYGLLRVARESLLSSSDVCASNLQGASRSRRRRDVDHLGVVYILLLVTRRVLMTLSNWENHTQIQRNTMTIRGSGQAEAEGRVIGKRKTKRPISELIR